MTAKQVDAVRTPHTPIEVYAALRTAAPAAVGHPLERRSLLLLLAQWALETGRGASTLNNNPAGIKHVTGDGHDWARYLTHEVIGGKVVTIPQDFRAYPSLDAAAVDYLALLYHRFALAWPALLAGDAPGFVRELAHEHYFTADEASYEHEIVSLVAELDRVIGAETVPDDGLPDEPSVVTSVDALRRSA